MPVEQLGSQGPGYPGLPGRVKTSGEKDGLVSRPELEVFGLAMLGGGMVFGAAHPYGELLIVWESEKTGVSWGRRQWLMLVEESVKLSPFS